MFELKERKLIHHSGKLRNQQMTGMLLLGKNFQFTIFLQPENFLFTSFHLSLAFASAHTPNQRTSAESLGTRRLFPLHP